MILTLRASHLWSTLGRRKVLPEFWPLPYSMVCPNISFRVSVLILPILLGIVIILFFRCMDTLLNPVSRTKGSIKWSLVAHTVAMFSVATVDTAFNFDLQSICYIDNRNFSGVSGVLLPGPFSYQQFIYSDAINVIPNIMFLLNTCLADGLLVGSVSNSATQHLT